MTNNTSIDWPPPYTLRKSRKARNISLQIGPQKGLELVVPYRVDVNEALAFLESRRAWIMKHAKHLKPCTAFDENHPLDLPSEIALSALNQTWNIRYHHFSKSKRIDLRMINERLIFTGNIIKLQDCLPALRHWIKQLAKTHFPAWIRDVSHALNLPFNQLTIRGQKTLWGSCSKERNINLNYKLLFLPRELAEYVFIHELCHTVYFNHSKRFWALVRQHEPNYKTYERELNNSDQYIPRWFYL